MTALEIKVRWIIAISVSVVLLGILAFVFPILPSFQDLQRVDGTVDTSTVDTRVEGSEEQTVFEITLEGNRSDNAYVVMKGADAGFYRATQVVASGDDVTLWTYAIPRSNDRRVWQLSDRGILVVNYDEVYGVERRYRSEIIGVVFLLLCMVNGITYFYIAQKTSEPEIPPMLGLDE